MAFFTRINSTVPFLPSDECHSENSTLKNFNEESTKRDIQNTSDNGDSKNVNDMSNHYDYVIDRVLGVEV